MTSTNDWLIRAQLQKKTEQGIHPGRLGTEVPQRCPKADARYRGGVRRPEEFLQNVTHYAYDFCSKVIRAVVRNDLVRGQFGSLDRRGAKGQSLKG